MGRVDSRFVTVTGTRMHYLSAGAGKPILFLHGMPTQAYLWRDIIPTLSEHAMCIAPDLIGMGQSDQPKLVYSIDNHVRYLSAFIEALSLQDITLVTHGWGSVIGLDYAQRHPNKIAALAFFESHLRPIRDKRQLSLPMQQWIAQLPKASALEAEMLKSNQLLDYFFPNALMGRLSPAAKAVYAKPFEQAAARLPLVHYLQAVPKGESDSPTLQLIARYSQWLVASQLPKLMLYAMPGFMTTMESVAWARDQLSSLTQVCLGEALHFAQESMPAEFAQSLKNWYVDTVVK